MHFAWKFSSQPPPKLYWPQTQNEPVLEISNNKVWATSKASDQPAHTRSLIRAFNSHLSILWLLSNWLNTIWSFLAQKEAADAPSLVSPSDLSIIFIGWVLFHLNHTTGEHCDYFLFSFIIVVITFLHAYFALSVVNKSVFGLNK